jgi:arylsulfate sulfotransferase
LSNRPRLRSAFALLALSFVCGCSSSSPNSNSSTPPANVTISITPPRAAIATGQSEGLQVTLSGDTAVTWSVNGVANGNSSVGTLTPTGLQGSYAAPAGATGLVATITATSVADTSKSATATVYVVPAGQVTPTANTLVATYTITPPSDAQVTIQFGLDTTYGFRTSSQATPTGGGSTGTYVAGMRASTPYHMRAVVEFTDGTAYFDTDQLFTTGALPTSQNFPITITTATTPGMTPAPGVEMLDLVEGVSAAIATDLQGNIVWYYPFTATKGTLVQPIRLIQNGHFLITLSPNTSMILSGTPPTPADTNEIREIDLAGNTIKSLNITTLNTSLAAAGFNITAIVFHHDVIALPNGHWIFLVALTQDFTNLTGFPGTTTVLGDAIVDVDANLNPVWVWNSFDYLDINRHPLNFPDWTHSNALLSTEDGNLLLSIRHQNWVIKIDYANGQGNGDILWHLGEGGDFTLIGGTDPTDWPYAQHGPAFFSEASAHVFNLGMMDNGDDRMYPGGEMCAAAGFTTCPFTAVPVYTLNENAMTATLMFDDRLSQYSDFGGDARPMTNGDVEFDLCVDDTVTTGSAAVVYEVTRTATPQVVWKMNIVGTDAYRAFRMPSLYPQVQW